MKRTTLAALVAAFASAAYAGPASAQETIDAARAKPPATLAGECQVHGVVNHSAFIGTEPRVSHWVFQATGTCTGVVNGELVQDTPVTWMIDATGPVSCTVGYSFDGRFELVFQDHDIEGDRKLTGTLNLVQTFTNNLHMAGDASGHATGQSTFFQNGVVETIQACDEGDSITSLEATNTFATLGPMSG